MSVWIALKRFPPIDPLDSGEKAVVIVETSRMLIRQLTVDDLGELAVMLADPEVMRHSIRGVLTEEETRGFISWCIGLYERFGYGPFALEEKSSSALIGFCGLSPETVGGVEEVHVGYRLARRFWGKGLATEAVRAVVANGFQQCGLKSVIAIVEPDHPASRRVVEKAGFGSIERQRFHGRDVLVYRKLDIERRGDP